jgi:hypothetical protein
MNIQNNSNTIIYSVCFFNFNRQKATPSQKTIDTLIADKAVQSIYIGPDCLVQKKQKTCDLPTTPKTDSSPVITTSPSLTTTNEKETKTLMLAKALHLTHKEQAIFISPQGKEFSLTTFIQRMAKHDMSGILNQKERLIASQKDLATLIELSECVCPEENVEALKIAKQRLIQIKTTLYETFVFAKDKGGLLERLSLLSAVLYYPLAFGAKDRDDTTDRAALLYEIKKYIDTRWPMDFRTGRGRNPNDPCWFPCNELSDKSKETIEAQYASSGFMLRFNSKEQKYAGIALNEAQTAILESNPLFVSLRGYIEKCLLRPSNSDGVCINDEAPNQFMGLFPPGMYFVDSEYDSTPFAERLKKLGGFAQAVLKTA